MKISVSLCTLFKIYIVTVSCPRISVLDHLGVVAGIIKDLNIVDLINDRIPDDRREEISTGEAIAAMIINGLGFMTKPLSLTPNFFENKPVELLFRKGVKPEHFNRSKLGRALDRVFAYGCNNLFYEIALAVCVQEKIEPRFNSLDTTTFSVSGEYDSEFDQQAVRITHGYSKDHRADLKQVVHELLVAQDGGVPLLMKSWDGNANDNKIMQERSKELVEKFKSSEVPKYLIADSKLYSKDNSQYLSNLNFITRIPRSNKDEERLVTLSFATNDWVKLDNENSYTIHDINHYNIQQRWIVVKSNAARNRAQQQIERKVEEELQLINSFNKKHVKETFGCKDDAEQAIKVVQKKLKYHDIQINISVNVDRNNTTLYQAQVISEKLTNIITQDIEHRSCYTLGTNIAAQELSAQEVIAAYKRQNISVEVGFRFLKDPIFFASSFFLKKNSRIEGLLLVMTLALLIYTIAQRRARSTLKNNDETIPNQINKPTQKPTTRWIFQLLNGINIVKLWIDNVPQIIIEGMNDLKNSLVTLFGTSVLEIYNKFLSSNYVIEMT